MDNIVEIENVKLIKQTTLAGLFRFLDYPDDEDVWIPWSLVEDESPGKDGELGVLMIPEWKAKELGFEV